MLSGPWWIPAESSMTQMFPSPSAVRTLPLWIITSPSATPLHTHSFCVDADAVSQHRPRNRQHQRPASVSRGCVSCLGPECAPNCFTYAWVDIYATPLSKERLCKIPKVTQRPARIGAMFPGEVNFVILMCLSNERENGWMNQEFQTQHYEDLSDSFSASEQNKCDVLCTLMPQPGRRGRGGW